MCVASPRPQGTGLSDDWGKDGQSAVAGAEHPGWREALPGGMRGWAAITTISKTGAES